MGFQNAFNHILIVPLVASYKIHICACLTQFDFCNLWMYVTWPYGSIFKIRRVHCDETVKQQSLVTQCTFKRKTFMATNQISPALQSELIAEWYSIHFFGYSCSNFKSRQAKIFLFFQGPLMFHLRLNKSEVSLEWLQKGAKIGSNTTNAAKVAGRFSISCRSLRYFKAVVVVFAFV